MPARKPVPAEERIYNHEEEDERVQFCSYCGELIELQEEEDDDNWDT